MKQLCLLGSWFPRLAVYLMFGSCLVYAAEEAGKGRQYFNEKEAPENLRDLRNIQKALQETLPQARAATVSIDLGGGSGSGVIVSSEGLVLTAAHVSAGVGKEMTVIMEDGTRHKAISLGLVATTDAAMIQIEEEGVFPYVNLDREDSTSLGDWVYALGHSGGFEKERGVGVRIGRLVRLAEETINSDCNLIGGDSGGPLFNMKGRLIGIHSRVGASLEQNMHVPLREFLKNWDAMLDKQFVGKGPFAQEAVAFLGVSTEDREEGGVVIKVVGDETPAAKAGLLEGDVILTLNGEELEGAAQFSASLQLFKPGEKVKLKILRDDERKEIEVELGEK
ncbi:MAG TPA: hypothetical protein DIV39_02865 [Verrucomicrobiales bacterium]|nr:hypothetical protein [Verrucomicrobiales bacterium]